jgi:glyoxylase-like metal-dependent hydrolase (beta-lactamase superfamily II)
MESLGPGLWAIDTGFQRPRFDAAYLLAEPGRAAFVDTGPNLAVPRLLQALDDLGIARSDVEWVILTHVHLDHAGGAGLLMEALPRARLVVHPRGARHIVDPSRLLAGVRAVYGAEIAARDYGEPRPVDGERIVQAVEGLSLSVGHRPLRFADTPGHAYHHVCIWDESSRGWFSGDTLGVSYPEFDFGRARFGIPSSTPTQFDPEALYQSVDRLMSAVPTVAYVTHYGAVGDVAAQAALVVEQTRAMVEMAKRVATSPARGALLRESLAHLYQERLRRARGRSEVSEYMSLLAQDIELNARGLEVWISAQQKVKDR